MKKISLVSFVLLLNWGLSACSSLTISSADNQIMLKEAKLAIQTAKQLKAKQFAPVEYRYARDNLNRALMAHQNGDYLKANRFAERAVVNAQLAKAKANAEMAELTSKNFRKVIAVVQEKMDDPWSLIAQARQKAYY